MPGSRYTESFNARLRDELLNGAGPELRQAGWIINDKRVELLGPNFNLFGRESVCELIHILNGFTMRE